MEYYANISRYITLVILVLSMFYTLLIKMRGFSTLVSKFEIPSLSLGYYPLLISFALFIISMVIHNSIQNDFYGQLYAYMMKKKII